MNSKNYRHEYFTRKEFREVRKAGKFALVIIPVGSIEQHLEHLPFNTDIATSTYFAERIADELYPNVLVSVPLPIGLSAHHMYFPGSITAKPGGWLAVLYDAIESFVRGGFTKVLVLNGHGGNVAPLDGAIDQLRYNLLGMFDDTLTAESGRDIWTHRQYVKRLTHPDHQKIELKHVSYWELVSHTVLAEVLEYDTNAGHAEEFETSVAMYVHPDHVRLDALKDSGQLGAMKASREKGKILSETVVEEGIKLARSLISI